MELTTRELKAIKKHLREKKGNKKHDELKELIDLVTVAIEINEYKMFNLMKGSRR